ncbi:MAG: DUF1186 domain-containing protein [Rhodobacteraceae bacterium]|nr:DUF1186 domain-containing protein [Paracoccaceae bacterium]
MTVSETMQRLMSADEPVSVVMREIRNERRAMGPVFVDLVTRLGHQPRREMSKTDVDLLVPVLFMLAEWRDPYAYRPFACLLRRPAAIIEDLLGEHTTENSFRILASLFDGDLTPLVEGACDPRADEFARGSFLCAMVLTAIAHPERRSEIERFFSTFPRICPEVDEEVALTWMEAVADLGLTKARETVRNAFDRHWIPAGYTDFESFEAKLDETIDGQGVPSSGRYRRFLITNAIGELY